MNKKIVAIKWLDSWGDPNSTSEVLTPNYMWSTGFLVEKNNEFVTICLSYLYDNRMREQLSIPYSIIKKYKIIGSVDI